MHKFGIKIVPDLESLKLITRNDSKSHIFDLKINGKLQISNLYQVKVQATLL